MRLSLYNNIVAKTVMEPLQGKKRSSKALAAVLCLWLAFTARTVVHNFEWADEETLFIAAQKVRESFHWSAALICFEHAAS